MFYEIVPNPTPYSNRRRASLCRTLSHHTIIDFYIVANEFAAIFSGSQFLKYGMTGFDDEIIDIPFPWFSSSWYTDRIFMAISFSTYQGID
jgi:hypothetical protein